MAVKEQKVVIEGQCETCGIRVRQVRNVEPENICEYLKRKHPNNGCADPKFSRGSSKTIE